MVRWASGIASKQDNVAIGRNMAGVHYYSDYYDSLHLGEKVAIGILEEQALLYENDEFVLGLTTFDGKKLKITRDGTKVIPYWSRVCICQSLQKIFVGVYFRCFSLPSLIHNSFFALFAVLDSFW